MSIFEYDDYKKWVRTRIQGSPKGGRGQLKKIADHLGASPTIVTQVFGGERELTPEQALLLAEFFALNKLEARFLTTLVHLARAGTHRYRESLWEELREMRTHARKVSSRVKENFVFTEEVKLTFYSNWYYSAIWSLAALEGYGDIESIAHRLSLPPRRVREVLTFLLRCHLLKEDREGRIRVGPSLIHLPSDSPQISRHHQNWRLQAFRRYENPGVHDAFYTAPVTLSAADVTRVRENVLRFISENVEIIKDSASEKLYCLNIDWFEV